MKGILVAIGLVSALFITVARADDSSGSTQGHHHHHHDKSSGSDSK
jgi:hypothetical protein